MIPSLTYYLPFPEDVHEEESRKREGSKKHELLRVKRKKSETDVETGVSGCLVMMGCISGESNM